MLNEALSFVRKQLDDSLRAEFGLADSVVALNSLVNSEGEAPQKNQNKLVVTLINLEAETSKQFYGGKVSDAVNVLKINPAVRFNLSALFSANFDDYEESLKFLSATIRYFQANNCLNLQNSPSIPQGVEKLQFEIESVDSFQIHNLWSSMGAKYIPSILYRIRHISIQANEIFNTVDRVTETELGVAPV